MLMYNPTRVPKHTVLVGDRVVRSGMDVNAALMLYVDLQECLLNVRLEQEEVVVVPRWFVG